MSFCKMDVMKSLRKLRAMRSLKILKIAERMPTHSPENWRTKRTEMLILNPHEIWNHPCTYNDTQEHPSTQGSNSIKVTVVKHVDHNANVQGYAKLGHVCSQEKGEAEDHGAFLTRSVAPHELESLLLVCLCARPNLPQRLDVQLHRRNLVDLFILDWARTATWIPSRI